jgi:hypothetical protein
VPDDLGKIARKVVKYWWTRHGLPYYIQKIEEENRVSFTTLHLLGGGILCSRKLMMAPRVMVPARMLV